MRNSRFESRKGYPMCPPEKFSSFISDLRNFKQFIKGNNINDLVLTSETCTFSVSLLGSVSLRVASVNAPENVTYSGNAMQINDFEIIVSISPASGERSEVMIALEADLNPILKMMASEPVKQLLTRLVDEMEMNTSWDTL